MHCNDDIGEVMIKQNIPEFEFLERNYVDELDAMKEFVMIFQFVVVDITMFHVVSGNILVGSVLHYVGYGGMWIHHIALRICFDLNQEMMPWIYCEY